jgi:hypothetical protein
MAAPHRTLPRALAAAALCAALLTATVARADEAAPPQDPKRSLYIVVPVMTTAVLVAVIVLVQAARAPARDVRPPAAALHPVDRALAAARDREAGYSTRWRTPAQLGELRPMLAHARAGKCSTFNVQR